MENPTIRRGRRTVTIDHGNVASFAPKTKKQKTNYEKRMSNIENCLEKVTNTLECFIMNMPETVGHSNNFPTLSVSNTDGFDNFI